MGRHSEGDPIDIKGLGLPEIPPAVVDGKPNIEHYRARLQRLSMLGEASYIQHGRPLQSFADQIRAIRAEAEMAGVDLSAAAVNRTEADIALDLIERLVEGGETLCEQNEAELVALRTQMDFADARVRDMVERNTAEARKAGAKRVEKTLERYEEIAKKVKALIDLTLELQDRARSEFPRRSQSRQAFSIRAAHLVRFMLYVGRSNMPEAIAKNGGVYDAADHLCAMALAAYEAETGAYYHEDGVQVGVVECDGIIINMPMGHGKTDFARAHAAMRVCKNPYTQGIMLHAIKDKAVENLEYLKSLFTPGTRECRRREALFPDLPPMRRGDKAKGKLRLDLPDRSLKAHTFVAHGVNEKQQGANSDYLCIDDPCDQEATDSESQRRKTDERIDGTWMPRLRGKRTFVLWVATLWHKDDATSRRIEAARSGKIKMKVFRAPCGGPDDGFRAVWPEVYSPHFLRAKYRSMRDPRKYAAWYMCNPISDESRIIRKLRLYDPESPEHARFLADARFYISVDPAGTNREGADKAGVIYAALGTVRTVDEESGVEIAEPRLRVIECYQKSANQSEIVEFVGGTLCQQYRVDEVHVETVSGYKGCAEMFENQWGIHVIRHGVSNKRKELRLRNAAPAIEHYYGRAVVEFPGEWAPGQDSDEDIFKIRRGGAEDLAEQIIDFGVARRDDAVDALSQIVNHLLPDLGIGTDGEVSRIARKVARRVDPFRKAMFDRIRAEERIAGMDEEQRFLSTVFN